MLVGAILAAIAAIIVVVVVTSRRSAPAQQPASGSDWWPPGISAAQRLRIEQIVLAWFAKQGEAVRLEDGCAITGDDHRYGLQNLAQNCAQSNERDWPELIAGHFESMRRSKAEQDDLARKANDYDAVAELIVPRVWNEDLPEGADLFVLREDLEGTRTVLSYDLPTCVTNVRPDHVKAWGRPLPEVFERAQRNLVEKFPVEAQRHELDGGVAFWLLGADHFYAASHALLLDRHPQCVGPYGALVAIPHRHVLLSYPVESMQTAVALNKLIPIAMGMYREGPGSVTPNVFWYRDGRFTNIPYEISDRTINIRPPDTFVELLNELAKTDREPATPA